MSAFLSMIIAGLATRMTFMAGNTLQSKLDYGDMMSLNDALLARAVIEDSHHNERSVARIAALANQELPLEQFNSREPFDRTKARADAGAALNFLEACDRVITYHHFNGPDRNFKLIVDNPLDDWNDHEALRHLKHEAA